MADYLCVERSALSHELMRMKDEGLIDYKKNWFKIPKQALQVESIWGNQFIVMSQMDCSVKVKD